MRTEDVEETPEEKAELKRLGLLRELEGTPQWGAFRDYLLGELSGAFEAFLDETGEGLLQAQGQARAVVRVLQEVDCAASRQDQIQRSVQGRYEAALARERADIAMAAQQGVRGRRATTPL